jgi:hypothetical protein
MYPSSPRTRSYSFGSGAYFAQQVVPTCVLQSAPAAPDLTVRLVTFGPFFTLGPCVWLQAALQFIWMESSGLGHVA